MSQTIEQQKEFRKQLLTTYHKYFTICDLEPLYLFGIEHYYGWDKILEPIFKKISELFTPEEISISQIKEKFGTLRFYVDYTDYKKIDDKKYDELNETIRKAEELSAVTCEICGEPGKTVGDFWLKTVCDKCNKDND